MDIQSLSLAVVVPVIVGIIKLIRVNIAKEFLPVITVAFGALADYLVRVAAAAELTWWSLGVGFLGIGLREALVKSGRLLQGVRS